MNYRSQDFLPIGIALLYAGVYITAVIKEPIHDA